MSILVTGAYGQLGQSIIKKLKQNNIPVLAFSKHQMNITDYTALSSCFLKYKPETVIHCAAYTDIDRAESERQKCFSINVTATQDISKLCNKFGSKLVYISTGYVFDGQKESAYEVTDDPKPINYYGLTKYEGELEIRNNTDKCFILRTSWLFSQNDNFFKSVIDKSKSDISYYEVNDRIGSPTFTDDLADLILSMIDTAKYGTYHATNEGSCSRYDFVKDIIEISGGSNYPKKISSQNYKFAAKRPLNTVLSKASLDIGGFKRLPEYRDAIRRCIKSWEADNQAADKLFIQ